MNYFLGEKLEKTLMMVQGLRKSFNLSLDGHRKDDRNGRLKETTFFQCLNFNLVPSNGGDKIASVLILQDLLGKLWHGLFPLFLDSLLAWLGVVVDEGVQDDGSGHLEVPVGKEWYD